MCLGARFDLLCHTLIVEPKESQCYTDKQHFDTPRSTLTSLDNLWKSSKQHLEKRYSNKNSDDLWESSRSKF